MTTAWNDSSQRAGRTSEQATQPIPPAAYTPATIARHWHTVIAASIEAGATPVMQLGGSANLLHTAAGLSALQLISSSRSDSALPVMVAGGAGGAWPAALLGPRVMHTATPAAYPNIYYGGEDGATRQICLLTWVEGLDAPHSIPHPKFYQALDAWMLSHRHPGQTTGTEALASALAAGHDPATIDTGLDLLGGPQGGRRDKTLVAGVEWSMPDTARWIGWAALAAAVLLPVLALFV